MTAYELRSSVWSSDVCSSYLGGTGVPAEPHLDTVQGCPGLQVGGPGHETVVIGERVDAERCGLDPGDDRPVVPVRLLLGVHVEVRFDGDDDVAAAADGIVLIRRIARYP